MADTNLHEAAPITDDTLAGMSDEEFAALDLSFLPEEKAEEPSVSDDPEEDNGGEPDDNNEPEEPAEEPEPTDPESEEEVPEAAKEPGEDDPDDPAADPKEPDADKAKEKDADPDKKPESDPTPVDYQAEYEKVLAPFKANGKEIKVDSVDEAVQLMQMGANYNKKMTALKPNLKLLKVLENNGLLSEEKLSYLIDLEKKNPDAVKKLVKDSGLDPLDIDVESDTEYQPKSYAVDDRELELDAVLDKIQDTPTYSKTIGVVSKKWDGASKKQVAEQPQLIEVINDHMASGIYDRISTEVEKQRMLGGLRGMSDLDAYQSIGDGLNAKGAFNDLFQQEPAKQPPQQKTVVKKPAAEDPKRADKKRAASSTRTAPGTSIDPEFNPLALSDEEFEKLGNQKLM